MKNKTNKIKQISNLKLLLTNEVHLGNSKVMWNPFMAPYIYGTRHGRHIFNLNETLKLFKRALNFLQISLQKRNKILFVGHPLGYGNKFRSKLMSNDPFKQLSYLPNQSALGGFLTNWSTHQNYREKALNSLNKSIKSKRIDLYEGLSNLQRKPDIIIFFNYKENLNLINEAKKLNIPVIVFLDTIDDPRGIDYPIPCNTKSRKSGKIYMDLISHIIEKNHVK